MIYCQTHKEELRNLYEGAQHIMGGCIVESMPKEAHQWN